MIRACEENDLPTVMDIGNRAWAPIYEMFKGRYGSELFQILVPSPITVKGEQLMAHWRQHPDWFLVCTSDDGRIVGFITFSMDSERKIGEVGNNAVDPTCGLKGIGQQLYAAVFERFCREEMLFAKVGTGLDEAHAPARRAYERAGFNIQHEQITYYRKL